MKRDILVRLCFHDDGRPTWFGIVCFLCAIIIASAVASLLGGCVNVAYTRNPFSHTKIETVYQSSRQAAGAGVIVAFPQMMSDNPYDYGWCLGNILTIPCGLLVECDALCEAVVDTVCLPVDWPLAASRDWGHGRW